MNPVLSGAAPLHIVRPMAPYESLPETFGLADALIPKMCHVVYFVRPAATVKPKRVRKSQEFRSGKRSVAETEAKYAANADVMRRMWAAGDKAYVIEAATGISRSAILRWLERNGLHQPSQRPKIAGYGSHRATFEGNLDLIKTMIAEGKRNVDIGQRFGMDSATVCRYVADMNLRAK